MRSGKERRKVFSNSMRELAPKWMAGFAAVFAVAALFSIPAFAQAERKQPLLSVLRTNVGVITNWSDRAIFRFGDASNFETFIGDVDGDGVTDAGTFDAASSLFTVKRSRDGSTLLASSTRTKGKPIVVPADYDGDKLTDLALWKNGSWEILLSSRGFSAAGETFGMKGDVPVPADFDGDKKADLTLFRPSENRWYIRSSSTGQVRTVDFGIAGTDLLVPSDYTGDGKADIAVYRGTAWHILDSETGREDTIEFGFSGARPVPADLDGDGTTDLCFFRKGVWYFYDGSGITSFRFGDDDDVPLSSVAVRESLTVR